MAKIILSMLIVAIIILFSFSFCFSFSTAVREEEGLISRISFGSCANQSSPQPIWDAIVNYKPDVFIWLGDNIYGDIRRPFKLFGNERTIGPWKNVPRFVPSSQHQMQSKYNIAKTNHGYSRLRQVAKVIGTWDDHDYGLNDAGKEFKERDINQKLMLDFLDEPHDSPRRKQAGVYASYTFGPQGRQIKVILLDTRYHRDPLRSDGTILGTAQWSWLKKELNGPPSEITIIGSSIQVVSNLSACTGPLFYMESWGRFPSERKRLFNLISNSKREGVLFISGDVHFGEITRFDCATTGYPLYDITSSGITQAVENVIPSFLHSVLRFLAWVTPTTMRVMNNNCVRKSCTYGQPNFGVIQVNWDANPVSLRFEVRGLNGEAVNSVTTSLSELQSKNGDLNPHIKGRHCSLETDLPWLVRHRLAILFSLFVAVLIVVQIGVLYVAVSLLVKCIRKCKLD